MQRSFMHMYVIIIVISILSVHIQTRQSYITEICYFEFL